MDLFRQRASRRSGLRRTRLQLEALEDRSLPAANATGVLTGVAFVDANVNHTYEPGETLLPGVALHLTGTTNQGGHVDVGVSTDDRGSYRFTSVPPGTYSLSAGPAHGFSGDNADRQVVEPSISIRGGETVTRNLAFHGLAPEFISMRQFLTSTTSADFPSSEPGDGSVPAGPRDNNAPFVKSAIADVSVNKNSTDTVLDLAGNFSDPDFTDSRIRFNTSKGAINVELFDTQTPRTVANFFNYINDNRFDNTIFHRLVNNFVLQGGGFKFVTSPSRLPAVATDHAIQNEFGASNTLGTIAMAKLGNDPNSATSQFFFNLADNRGTPPNGLDFQNGGFTVFGRLVGSADQQVVNALASLQIKDESKGDPNSAFGSIPMDNYNGTNFPTDTNASNYALVNDVQVVKRDEFLTYKVLSNSNTGLVSASIIENNRLDLHYTTGATGSADITVRATDRFGASVDATIHVTVTNHPPTADFVLSPASPGTNATLTATATASDPDGDPVKLTYVWKVNGTTVRTTSNTSSLTDALDLSQPGNGNTGDTITVEVTPSDGTVNGTTVIKSVTVA